MPKASSKKQQRWYFAAERRGDLKPGTARRHARSGKAYKKLPLRKGRRKKA